MGIIKLDAYVLLISGQDRYTFLDGLSTNKVDSSCSTVLTTTSAKIIDVVDVIQDVIFAIPSTAGSSTLFPLFLIKAAEVVDFCLAHPVLIFSTKRSRSVVLS